MHQMADSRQRRPSCLNASRCAMCSRSVVSSVKAGATWTHTRTYLEFALSILLILTCLIITLIAKASTRAKQLSLSRNISPIDALDTHPTAITLNHHRYGLLLAFYTATGLLKHYSTSYAHFTIYRVRV